MDGRDSLTVTSILQSIEQGSVEQSDGMNQLFEAVYGELRGTAQALMFNERREHTLQPTALVNEAYIRLVDAEQLRLTSRVHFFGIAARAMRQILVDHARSRGRKKRGGDLTRVELTVDLPDLGNDIGLLELNEALDRLKEHNAQAYEIVELWIFGGLRQLEIAALLAISDRTVRQRWTFARMWLLAELDGT